MICHFYIHMDTSVPALLEEKGDSFALHCFLPPPQATKRTASRHQIRSFPLPQRSHDDHTQPLQSERGCPSEPNCSGRSQTKHSASQPG